MIVKKLASFWLPLLAIYMCLPTRAAAGTVADRLGHRVVVPDNPGRVISLAPGITEIVIALKQENRLKGATRYSDYPRQAKKGGMFSVLQLILGKSDPYSMLPTIIWQIRLPRVLLAARVGATLSLGGFPRVTLVPGRYMDPES